MTREADNPKNGAASTSGDRGTTLRMTRRAVLVAGGYAATGLAAAVLLPGSSTAAGPSAQDDETHAEGGEMEQFDAVIVGGGPAGLAAALTLGRSRRRTLLCDAGVPRNAAASHIRNFVTRDGTPPAAFRAIGREQLEPYPSVEVPAAERQHRPSSLAAHNYHQRNYHRW